MLEGQWWKEGERWKPGAMQRKGIEQGEVPGFYNYVVVREKI